MTGDQQHRNHITNGQRVSRFKRLGLIEEDGIAPHISTYCKCEVSDTDNNGTIDNNAEQFDTVKDVYAEMCRRFVFTPIGNFSEVFTYEGKTFADRLAEVNAP